MSSNEIKWVDILMMMRQKKSDVLKCFSDISDLSQIGPYVVGMANHQGGQILIGADVYNFHIVGTSFGVDDVKAYIHEHCYPDISIDVIETFKHSLRLLMIQVNQMTGHPCYYQNTCYIIENCEPKKALLTTFKDRLKFKGSNPLLEPDAPLMEPSSDLLDYDVTSDHLGEEIDRLEVFRKETHKVTLKMDAQATKSARLPQALDHVPFVDSVSVVDGMKNEVRDDCVWPEKEGKFNKRQTAILDYLKSNDSIRNKIYRQLYHVSHKTAHLELTDLMNRGLILKKGQGRSTCYVLLS